MHFTPFVSETDSQQLGSRVTFPTSDLPLTSDFIQIVRSFLLSKLSLTSIQYVNRKVNIVIHRLTYMNAKMVANQLRFNDIPAQLIPIV